MATKEDVRHALTLVADSRQRFIAAVGYAISKAKTEFEAETGLVITDVDVVISSYQYVRDYTASSILSNVAIRTNIERASHGTPQST